MPSRWKEMGNYSQRKGATGERELCSLLQAHGFAVERGGSLSFGEVPDLTGLPGIHIEVKRTERLNLRAAMDQAERDAGFFRDGARRVPQIQPAAVACHYEAVRLDQAVQSARLH